MFFAPVSEDRPSTTAGAAVSGSQSKRTENGTPNTNAQLEANRFGLTADEKKNAVLTARTLPELRPHGDLITKSTVASKEAVIVVKKYLPHISKANPPKKDG